MPAGAVSEEKVSKKGIGGAFVVGVVSGVISTSCDIAILVAIVSLAPTIGGGWITAAAMLLLYSLGRGVMIVATSMSVGLAQSMSTSGKLQVVSKIVKIVMGILILALGAFMIYTAITTM